MATASSCRQLGGARVPGGCSRHLSNISRHLQPFRSRSHPLQHRLQRTSYTIDLPSNRTQSASVKCGAVLQQSRTSQIAGAVLLAGCWLIGRPPAPAAAAIRSPQHLETVVSIAPQGVAAASVTNESDSLPMIMAACIGFWVASATISAGIAGIMKLAGRPMAYGSGGGGAGWESAGVMDLDIMTLPLAIEGEPIGGGPKSTDRDDVKYKPWDGPDTYIPVSMVKVFQPGFQEAGRVARPSLLAAEGSNLSIVSVTRPADAALTGKLPTNGNGSNGNGNGNGNGSNNGKNSSSNGSNGSNGGSSSGKESDEPK